MTMIYIDIPDGVNLGYDVMLNGNDNVVRRIDDFQTLPTNQLLQVPQAYDNSAYNYQQFQPNNLDYRHQQPALQHNELVKDTIVKDTIEEPFNMNQTHYFPQQDINATSSYNNLLQHGVNNEGLVAIPKNHEGYRYDISLNNSNQPRSNELLDNNDSSNVIFKRSPNMIAQRKYSR